MTSQVNRLKAAKALKALNGSKVSKRILPLGALQACASERSLVVKAMAHPTRLLVIEALMHGEQCVNDITAMAGCDVTTLSKHLSVMKKAGLLVCEKRGLNVYYQIACPCFADFFRCIDLISTTRESQRACSC